MQYVEAFSREYTSDYSPEPGEVSLFLGGGVSDSGNWQSQICQLLGETDLVVLNPRRAHWPTNDPAAAAQQIEWEYQHLQKATLLAFWFAPETLCPITLFEYGKWIARNKPLFIGCHPDYKLKLDVEVQTRLERSLQRVCCSLEELARSVISFVVSRGGSSGAVAQVIGE